MWSLNRSGRLNVLSCVGLEALVGWKCWLREQTGLKGLDIVTIINNQLSSRFALQAHLEEWSDSEIWIMFVSCSHFLTLLLLLLQVLGVPCEPVHQGMDCNEDRPATLCLTKDYSTFDLPFRSKPNLIKIGNLNLMIELQTIKWRESLNKSHMNMQTCFCIPSL